MFVSWGLAVTCGIDPVQAIAGFSKGFGDILSFVGIVIGLGTMIGGLLVSSGVLTRLLTPCYQSADGNTSLGRLFLRPF